ncbi:MAG: response regulator transcription factor [Eggerthellaceae bacterium]|nr:response regulator transcription factor [Eggerthellaceae bacterium]
MRRHAETVLVVEDDAQIQRYICYALKNEGFAFATANNAQNALSKLVSEQVDIMLLDLGLPDRDGIEVIKEVRAWTDMPIIVVSARDQDSDKVAALDSGADDYLTKPISAAELLARIRVALRHLDRQGKLGQHAALVVGGLKMDLDKHIVSLDGEEVHLTPMEYSLLLLLISNMGKVLTTGTIIREIWGVGYGTDTQALRTLMAGLRRKIEADPARPRYIMTEIGVGYRLVDE